MDSIRAIPDQSLGSVRDSSGNEADSSESIDSSDNITSSDTLTFRSCHNTSDQIPDSSSSNSKSTENTIDSQQTDYPRDQVSTSDEPLIGNVTESENSQADSQTSEIYQNVDNSENAVDSSSNTNISEFHQEIQPDDICQSSTSQVGNAVEIVSLSDSERVSSTESTVNWKGDTLTHFRQMLYFCTPWKCPKNQMFSGGKEMVNWHEISAILSHISFWKLVSSIIQHLL